MFVIYLYDIKAKNKKEFNRVKRLFYYHLNKLNLKKEFWKTKSVLAVPLELEPPLDRFFKKVRKSIKVYKISADSIEKMY